MVEDDTLISRAQSGDEQAFVDLMRAYHAYVFAIVIGIVDNAHDAEDVVQDAFINAYRGLSQLEDTTKFKSWLAEIARNCARNSMRKRRVDTVPIDEVSADTLRTRESPSAQLIRDEQIELIHDAMETLPEKEREIARAYYLDGASYEELIRRHGLSYKTISFRLSRAKRTLAKRLQYLLTGAFVPPATTLKKITSGGFTAMKIGTVSKIAVGVIAIVVIVFIGSRQLISPREDSSPSDSVTASIPGKSVQTTAEINAIRRSAVGVPLREDKRQISAEEMKQVESFFAQLDATATQTEVDTPQIAADAEVNLNENESGGIEQFATQRDTTQSAEDVMNAYVEAYRHLDFKAMQPLLTAEMRERRTYSGAPTGFVVEEVRRETADGTEVVADPEVVEEARLQFERLMFEPVLKMMSQAAVVDSAYVDDEFHFRLGMPAPEMPVPSGEAVIETEIPPPPDTFIKMRKEEGAWRIYDSETLN